MRSSDMHEEAEAMLEYNEKRGKIVVIPGTVDARKTTTLKKQVLGHLSRGQRGLVVVFGDDIAYKKWPERQRDRGKIESLIVTSTAELSGYLSQRTGLQFVGIDNAHLSGPELVSICRRLAWNGAIVYIAGQTQDRLRRAYHTMIGLMALADEIWHPFPAPRCYFCGYSVAPLVQLTSRQIPLDGQPNEVDWSRVEPRSVMAVPCCRGCFTYSSEDAIVGRLQDLGLDTTQERHTEITGSLELVTGPMFSGKTFTAIGMAEYITRVRRRVAVFVHGEATKKSKLVSHSGSEWKPAHRVANAREVWDQVLESPRPEWVIIDEAQFFDPDLVPICVYLAQLGYQVFVSGVNLYWSEEPFGPVPELMALADRAYLLTAMCSRNDCKEPATRTLRRSASGLPAEYGSLPEKDPGGKEKGYEPRCSKHYLVPGHPAYATVDLALE